MPRSDCPSEQELLEFHLGTLPSTSLDAVAEHLEACGRCEAAVRRLDDSADPVLAALRRPVPPASSLDEGISALPPVDQPDLEELPDLPDYEVLGPLGRGGMGVVYRARQLRLNREVALKRLPSGTGRELGRSRAEAEALARLQHPNIIQIHEIIEHGGRLYLALELVDGGSLHERLNGRPYPPRPTAELVEVLARAVQHAHERGVIHRDLKPANVLLVPAPDEPAAGPGESFGTPKLTDFGIAKRLAGDAGQTLAGEVIGTPTYMAPEQAAGRAEAIGPATDVYGLGVLLYELLTGRVPLQGPTTLDTLVLVRTEEPVPPRRLQPRLPRDLETVCLKCLQKEPAKRYASALALAEDLRRFLHGRPVLARPVGALERAGKWARRRPVVAGLAAAFVTVLLGGTVASTYFALEAGRRAVEADKARGDAEQAQRQSDLRAAERTFAAGTAQAEAGLVDQGLFTQLEALRLAPPDAADLRRVIRANLAAWGDRLPVLRCIVPGRDAAFLGPGGENFATLEDGRMYRRSAATGRPVAAAVGQPDREAMASLGRDGRHVAILQPTASGFRVAVWETATGRQIGRSLEYRRADYPRRQRWIAVDGGLDVGDVAEEKPEEVRCWDVRTAAPVGPPVPQEGLEGWRVVRTRGGGPVLIAFRTTPGAEFWDLASGKRLARLPELAEADPSLRPDGRSLVSVGPDGTVRRWDPETGNPVGPPWRPERAYFGSGQVTPDGRAVVILCRDGRARFYDLATHQPCAAPVGPDLGLGAALRLGPDGSTLLAAPAWERGTGRRLARLWQLAVPTPAMPPDIRPTPTVLDPLTAARAGTEFNVVTYSPDRRTVFVGDAGPDGDEQGRLVETATGRPLGRPLRGGAAGPWRLAAPVGGLVADGPTFSPDGRLLATCSRANTWGQALSVRVWDAATGAPVTPPLPSPQFVHALAFSPDGRVLAVGHGAGVELWDLPGPGPADPDGTPRPARRRPWLDQRGPVSRLTFSPDGSRLAASTRPGWGERPGFRLWDPASGKPVGDFVPADDAPHVHFSSDGRWLEAFDPARGTGGQWDAVTGRPLAGSAVAFTGWQQPTQWAWSADGTRLATGQVDGTVQQWDPATGRRLDPPLAHAYPVVGLAYSPDGRTLAVGCDDGVVRLWDAATGLPLGPPLAHPVTLLGLAFADERTLLTTTRNGSTGAWPVPAPLPDDPDRIALWLRAATGERADGPALVPLAADDWAESCRQLHARWPEAERLPGPPGGRAAWHDARARDAEQAGNAVAERWHLDRLIALGPASWLPYARRARLESEAGDLAAARADYARAAEHGGGEALLDWYRHRARTCALRGRAETAGWYLDRLLDARPDDWHLYAERAEADAALGRDAEGERDEARAVDLGADRDFLAGLAASRAARGRWPAAAALLARANAADPPDVRTSYLLGLACLKAGDAEGHRRACARLLAALRDGHLPLSPDQANAAAMLCALAPKAVDDWTVPAALARAALEGFERLPLDADTRRRVRHNCLNTWGVVLYRAGRYGEAVDRLSEALDATGDGGGVEDWLFLALAHQALGRAEQARKWRDRAAGSRTDDGPFSWDRAEQELLRRELDRR